MRPTLNEIKGLLEARFERPAVMVGQSVAEAVSFMPDAVLLQHVHELLNERMGESNENLLDLTKTGDKYKDIIDWASLVYYKDKTNSLTYVVMRHSQLETLFKKDEHRHLDHSGRKFMGLKVLFDDSL